MCAALTQVVHAQSTPITNSSILAFHNVNVFDGTRMLRGVNVVVEGGMIRAIGPPIAIPASAEMVEGQGKTLLPGLIDSHSHLGERLVQEFLEDALGFGITTELEMGGSAVSLKVRKEGCPECADFLTAGTVVTVPGGHPTEMAATPVPDALAHDDSSKSAQHSPCKFAAGNPGD
jgi:cytosine/adenosine deaminase-related metal-dependent hydrolase